MASGWTNTRNSRPAWMGGVVFFHAFKWVGDLFKISQSLHILFVSFFARSRTAAGNGVRGFNQHGLYGFRPVFMMADALIRDLISKSEFFHYVISDFRMAALHFVIN